MDKQYIVPLATVKYVTKNVLVSLIWVETSQTCFAGPGTISAVPPTDYHSGRKTFKRNSQGFEKNEEGLLIIGLEALGLKFTQFTDSHLFEDDLTLIDHVLLLLY